MQTTPRLRRSLVIVALVTAAGGCGSSSDQASDQAPDQVPDSSASPDAPIVDTVTAKDAAADTVAVGLDGPAQSLDGSKPSLDGQAGSISEADSGTGDASPSRPDTGTGATDTSSQTDGPSDAGGGQTDGPAEVADAGFVPGPATAALVNTGSAGEFSLADGTWKVFYFDAVVGQVYAVSGLSGIVHGYVSTSALVAPSNYQFVTNSDGNLSFTAAATQRYYIAVAVSGGGVSGSFQVAEGGTLIALGSTVLALTAPDGDNTYFYRFPITTGRGYTFTATGSTQTSVKIAVAPRAERSSSGQFSYSAWGVGGGLPFTAYDIPAASVATSYSGFYFFYINVTAAMTITVTIAEASM
jgi:hypothetical protein